jgi:hypothetical protein
MQDHIEAYIDGLITAGEFVRLMQRDTDLPHARICAMIGLRGDEPKFNPIGFPTNWESKPRN